MVNKGPIEVYAVGGYNEVGKNMTAIKIKNDSFIFDCGLYIPPIAELEEKTNNYTTQQLRRIRAIPDDMWLEQQGIRPSVRVILISHAHLDHVGGVPFLAQRYKAPVIGTPFTMKVLDCIQKDNNIKIPNQIKSVPPNSSIKIKGDKNYDVEFIHVTHSTLQCTFVVVHTDVGAVVYANDFKLDNYPVLGQKSNIERLKEIVKSEGIKAFIVDSLYSEKYAKTPSEKIARYMLEDLFMTLDNEQSAIFVSTFSSHIARLKSIVDFGKILNREIIFVGRSLNKYVSAASNIKMAPFIKDIQTFSYSDKVKKILRKVNENRKNYLVVCTGHQGEPGSILDRIAKNELPFQFRGDDHMIFSSSIIPTSINIENRDKLDKKIRKMGTRIFSDIHVSGHACREDLREIVKILNPENVIPAHGAYEQLLPMTELLKEMGYKQNKDIHLMQDREKVVI